MLEVATDPGPLRDAAADRDGELVPPPVVGQTLEGVEGERMDGPNRTPALSHRLVPV